ncbi:MAG: hypothetical protein DRQ98_14260 [Gammaproteobacteria bacterium]|nr:MAG: hypothetical protein DRQ98_14260 [Gammaproteobacteria bacterium]
MTPRWPRARDALPGRTDSDWHPSGMSVDDFCWKLCDDGSLQLDFALGAGSYATALPAEFVQFKEGKIDRGNGSEQG